MAQLMRGYGLEVPLREAKQDSYLLDFTPYLLSAFGPQARTGHAGRVGGVGVGCLLTQFQGVRQPERGRTLAHVHPRARQPLLDACYNLFALGYAVYRRAAAEVALRAPVAVSRAPTREPRADGTIAAIAASQV